MKTMSEERAAYIAEAIRDDAEQSNVEFRNPIEQVGFARMEHVVGLDTSLSDGAYRTLAILKFFSMQKDSAFPAIDTLAELRGVKGQTIKRHIAELVEKKIITRSRRIGTSSMTYIEDLPQEYTDAAQMILESRKQKRTIRRTKNDTNECTKNDTTVVSKIVRKEEPVKEEPVKEVSAKAEHVREEITRIHNLTEEEKEAERKALEEFESIPSASANMQPPPTDAAREFFAQFRRKRWKTQAEQDLFERTERDVGPARMLDAVMWASQNGICKVPAICTAARKTKEQIGQSKVVRGNFQRKESAAEQLRRVMGEVATDGKSNLDHENDGTILSGVSYAVADG